MKSFAITSIIAASMLLTVGCKTQNQPNQQVNQEIQQQQDAQALTDTQNAQNDAGQANTDAAPKNTNDSEANTDSPTLPAAPGSYVDIADWCRPGMTEPINAQEWAKANNAFGLKFLAQTKGNTVFSPYSIERALGMTLDGACGETASEMLSALELPNATRLSLSGREVDDAMKSVNDSTMLEIENTLWPDITISLAKDYLARISAGYQNKSVSLDYKANPEKARITINNDVAKSTHDRIIELLPKGSISDLTRLVLTNAVYFKSKWLHQFEVEETKLETFHNSDKEIKTNIMHAVEKSNRVCIADDYAVYDLDFDSSKEGDLKGAYVMRIVLPTIDDNHPMNKRMDQLEKIEKQLSGDFTSACRNDYFDKVYVSMPKFKLAPDTMSISYILHSMGMNKAFDEDEAELHALVYNAIPKPTSRPGLYIHNVYHKAFIEIDESGGEAAAATAVVINKKSAARERDIPKIYYFTVDHPFLYMIMEKSTGAAIFMGRVTDL